MIDEIYLPAYESTGSVLGFIPDNYPQGVAILEAWDKVRREIVKVTCLVSDIHDREADIVDIKAFPGRDGMERAVSDATGRALYFQHI